MLKYNSVIIDHINDTAIVDILKTLSSQAISNE